MRHALRRIGSVGTPAEPVALLEPLMRLTIGSDDELDTVLATVAALVGTRRRLAPFFRGGNIAA